MVRTPLLAAVALLTGCGFSADADEALKLEKQMETPAAQIGATLPSSALKCVFESRSYCIGGECRAIEQGDTPMYVEIDSSAGTYKRCGPKPGDCDIHAIKSISRSGETSNVLVGEGGTLFKYVSNGRFTDIATQGPQTFISGGTCSPVP